MGNGSSQKKPQISEKICSNKLHFVTETGTPHSHHICQKDFKRIQYLGNGASGNVYLVERNNHKYAMKVIKKDKIFRYNQIEYALVEKEILQNNKHPFIVDLHYSFQSEQKVYLIMEFIEKGELFFILEKFGKFNFAISQFIIAQLVLVIEHLHTKLNVIYRDIKPENIFVCNNGYIKLGDFGLSKQLKNGMKFAHSMLGTIEYMAPEIVLGDQYDSSVDLWSLGVLLFEFMVGRSPFMEMGSSYEDTRRRIIKGTFDIPDYISKDTKDFMHGLLQIDPNKRLGSNGNYESIKKHKFFAGLDWEQLIRMELQSPLAKLLAQMDEHNIKVDNRTRIMDSPVVSGKVYPNIVGISFCQLNDTDEEHDANDNSGKSDFSILSALNSNTNNKEQSLVK